MLYDRVRILIDQDRIVSLFYTLMHIRRQRDVINRTLHASDIGWSPWIFQANSSVDARVLLVATVSECSIYSVVHYDLDIGLRQFDLLVVDLNYECVGLDVAYWQL